MTDGQKIFKYDFHSRAMGKGGGLRPVCTYQFYDEAGNLQSVQANEWQQDLPIDPLYLFVSRSKSKKTYTLQRAQYTEKVTSSLNPSGFYDLKVTTIDKNEQRPKVEVVDAQHNTHVLFLNHWQVRSLQVGQTIKTRVAYLNGDIDTVQFELADLLDYGVFREGNKYRFTCVNSVWEESGLICKDDYDCLHKISLPPEFKKFLESQGKLETELYYLGQTDNGHLDLKYFRSFLDIIPFKSLKGEVFDPLWDTGEEDLFQEDVNTILSYYRAFDNKWIKAFSNYIQKIYPILFDEGDLEEARVYTEVALLLEQWIVQSEFRYSLESAEERANLVKQSKEDILEVQNWLECIDLFEEGEAQDFVKAVVHREHLSLDRCKKMLKIARYYVKNKQPDAIDTLAIYEKAYFHFTQEDWRSIYVFYKCLLEQHIELLLEQSGFDELPLFSKERRDNFIGNEQLAALCQTQFELLRFSDLVNPTYCGTPLVSFLHSYANLILETRERIAVNRLGISLLKSESKYLFRVLKRLNFSSYSSFKTSLKGPSQSIKLPDLEHLVYKGDMLRLLNIRFDQNVIKGKMLAYDYFLNLQGEKTGKHGYVDVEVVEADRNNGLLCLEIKVQDTESNGEVNLTVGEVYDVKISSIEEDRILVELGEEQGFVLLENLSLVLVNEPERVFALGEKIKVILKEIQSQEDQGLLLNFDRKEYLLNKACPPGMVAKNEMYLATLCSISNKIGLFFEVEGLPRVLVRRDQLESNGHNLEQLFQVGERLPVQVLESDENGCLSKIIRSNRTDATSQERALILDLFKPDALPEEWAKEGLYCSKCLQDSGRLQDIQLSQSWYCATCRNTPQYFALLHVPVGNQFTVYPINTEREYHVLVDKFYQKESIVLNSCIIDEQKIAGVSLEESEATMSLEQLRLLSSLYENWAFEATTFKHRKEYLEIAAYFASLSAPRREKEIKYYLGFFDWAQDFLRITGEQSTASAARLKALLFLSGREFLDKMKEKEYLGLEDSELAFYGELGAALQDMEKKQDFSKPSTVSQILESFYRWPLELRTVTLEEQVLTALRSSLYQFMAISEQQ